MQRHNGLELYDSDTEKCITMKSEVTVTDPPFYSFFTMSEYYRFIIELSIRYMVKCLLLLRSL